MYKNKDEFGRLISTIGEPLDINMEQILEESHKEFMELMEQNRRELRQRIANDPTRCHCPFCTILGN